MVIKLNFIVGFIYPTYKQTLSTREAKHFPEAPVAAVPLVQVQVEA